MSNPNLIRKIRELRYAIAERRVAGTVEHYPEITGSTVVPLDDAAIIEKALTRELAHQRRVWDDMQKARA